MSLDTKTDRGWIQLSNGKPFWPLDPQMEDLEIEPIAHALSNQCRFTGHSKFFYSIAQHSLQMSYFDQTKKHGLKLLLHDASEAFLTDVSSPVKHHPSFWFYRQAEDRIQTMIYEKFTGDPIPPWGLEIFDEIMLATEARDLLSPLHPDWKFKQSPVPEKIPILSSTESYSCFMARYETLSSF